ncbi:hypothetical protein [Trichloromonas sp.]|uniref:hypothetical protein n=1 Tax=Trichloromonas sp. TaxID=3069249 RepID=UPI003D81C083
MPIAPPSEVLLDNPAMELMDLFGRMRSLADAHNFQGTLPAVWQCSDESQGIKQALFGYAFDCPTFNLGRVGALLDPGRLTPASHHGQDLVILGGSHHGIHEEGGIGYVERVNGHSNSCCSMLFRVVEPYLTLYRRAATLITLYREVDGIKIEIPYKYLFRQPPGDTPQIHVLLRQLVDGTAIRESSHGKVYRLSAKFADRHQLALSDLNKEPRSIGTLLDAHSFRFIRHLDKYDPSPAAILEASVLDFFPDIVTSKRPHRRLADVNTWRQFHLLASYLTDSFDNSDRSILMIAGLTLDHSIRRNTFVPQFGFLLDEGKTLQARYFGPDEVSEWLQAQPVFRPQHSFLEYAGAG